MSTTIVGTALCDYCHQKPRYNAYPYCGKTCAAQAATLCIQCHQKPKFGNFDYCGKKCAAAGGHRQAKTQAVAAVQPAGNVPNAPSAGTTPSANSSGLGSAPTKVAPQGKRAPKPAGVQMAQPPPQPQPAQTQSTVTQLLQAGISFIPSRSATTKPGPQQAPVGFAPGGGQSQVPSYSGTVPQHPAIQSVTNAQVVPAVPAPAPLPNLKCLIPECDQLVHVDGNGAQTSDFCSQRHREEAVESGLVSPCIMCQIMPQSRSDYFCSRACREEALNKQ